MAIPVAFATLCSNYPTPTREPRDTLYGNLGWDGLIGDRNYENTCAIRMSICLLRSGLSIPTGELKIWKGPLKGKHVKIHFDDLARHLTAVWGNPEVLSRPTEEVLESKGDGVIAFFGLPGGYRGHIDLFAVTKTNRSFLSLRWSQTSSVCGTQCYFGSREALYWAA